MLTVRLRPEACLEMRRACERAGSRETGGMLFAEHSGEEEFTVLEATVAATGWISTFVRTLGDGLRRLEAFFKRTRHEYTRFNYVGEWHSHPSFALEPSSTDDETMHSLAADPAVGARFVVLVIVRIEDGVLRGAGWAYSNAGRHVTRVILDRAEAQCSSTQS